MEWVEDVLPNHIGTHDDTRSGMQESHSHPDGEDGILLSKALTRAQSVVARVAELLAYPEIDETEHASKEAIKKRGVAIE